MNYLFPEIKQEYEKTLVIIGNGFDLASGIKSSYSDFKQWLQENNRHRLISLMDIFFSNQRDLWGDIEMALGEYNEDSILEYCRPDEAIDYDHPTRSMAAVEDSPEWIFSPLLDEFIEAFNDWVNCIDISNAKRIREMPIECKYLTFNYTETLEKIYGISVSNILHIHGSRILDNNYIIGHNNYRDPDEAYNDENHMLYLQATWSKIIRCMNDLVKDSTSIIKRNVDFFRGLSGIAQIVVYGHSFSKVDWPYMKEILKHVGTDKPWSISYHSIEDFENINAFVTEMGLTNVRTFSW